MQTFYLYALVDESTHPAGQADWEKDEKMPFSSGWKDETNEEEKIHKNRIFIIQNVNDVMFAIC